MQKSSFIVVQSAKTLFATTPIFASHKTNKKLTIMKKKLFLSGIMFCMGIFGLQAQNNVKPTAAFLGMETKGFSSELQSQVNNILRLEINRINKYELLEESDVTYLASAKDVKITNCFGKICLIEVGQAIGVKKMITGSVQNLGDNLIINLKVYDVAENREEYSQLSEFLNVPTHIRTMMQITVNSMFGLPNDEATIVKLSRKDDYENTLNTPNQVQLRSDGPRMGLTFFTGEAASVIKSKENHGGYDGYPYMFQFGYQFEKMYLNEGNFQALFEFIPMVTGLDQGLFIPSFTLLNGLRNNQTGWEFAFGPTFSVSRKSYGFYDSTDNWIRVNNTNSTPASKSFDNQPDVLQHRIDSRGIPTIQTGFLVAAGKTFKSGKLNIPVNMYMIPGKNSFRFGLSMGFNSRKRY